MSVEDSNQALANARDDISMNLYEALQKCKQGIRYDTRMEVVFQNQG